MSDGRRNRRLWSAEDLAWLMARLLRLCAQHGDRRKCEAHPVCKGRAAVLLVAADVIDRIDDRKRAAQEPS